MPTRVGADPDLLVGWRNREAGDAGKLCGSDQRPIVGLDVGEILTLAQPADAGIGVGNVDEPGCDSHFRRLAHRILYRFGASTSSPVGGRRRPRIFHETSFLAWDASVFQTAARQIGFNA